MVELLATVKLFKAIAFPEIVWALSPLSSKVPVPAFKEPLFIKFPERESVAFPKSKVDPVEIVTLLAITSLVNVGLPETISILSIFLMKGNLI